MSAVCRGSRLPLAWSVERLCIPHPRTGRILSDTPVPAPARALMRLDGLAWTEPRTIPDTVPDPSFTIGPEHLTLGTFGTPWDE